MLTNQEKFNNAIKHNNIETVILLLKNKEVSPCTDNNNAIRYASDNGYTDIVRLLINDKRVNPSYMHEKIFFEFIVENDLQSIDKLLLDPLFVKYNENIELYFSHIVEYNMIDMFNVLFSHKKINIGYSNSFIIRECAHYARFNMIEKLLTDSRINPNVARELPIRVSFRQKTENPQEDKYLKTFNLIWGDLRVKKSLEENHKNLYIEISEHVLKHKLNKF